MAIVLSGTVDPRFKGNYRRVESDIEVVADTIELAVSEEFPHGFISLQFFADALGAAFAIPGAGTVVISVDTVNNPDVAEAITGSPMDATAAVTLNFEGNALRINCIPTGLTTATHWRAVWTGNLS